MRVYEGSQGKGRILFKIKTFKNTTPGNGKLFQSS